MLVLWHRSVVAYFESKEYMCSVRTVRLNQSLAKLAFAYRSI